MPFPKVIQFEEVWSKWLGVKHSVMIGSGAAANYITTAIVRELKEREYYEKPSERRRKEKARAVKRWEKKVSTDLKKQAYIERKSNKR